MPTLTPDPLVSVIIPAYKHRDFILQALESVFAQTYPHYEVIVVNDGSPDDTEAVVRPLAEAGRIRYIAQKNAGQSSARNRGIAEAKGEFVALLDDDDMWPADKLQWQVEALRTNPDAALVYGPAATIDKAGELFAAPTGGLRPADWLDGGPSGNVHEDCIQTNYIVSPGQCLFRRAKLVELDGPFDLNIKGGADDWDLYLNLSRRSPFVFVAKTALLYRLHDSNASRNASRMWESVSSVMLKHEKAETDPAFKGSWRRKIDKQYSGMVSYAVQALGGESPNEDGWTHADSWLWLRRLPRYAAPQLLARSVLIARVQLGMARTRISLAFKRSGQAKR